MGTSTFQILFLSTLLLLLQCWYAKSVPKPRGFVFPIKKDSKTSQYYTTIHIGSNATTLNVVIDLEGKFVWFNSAEYLKGASSYRPVLCGTRQCSIADSPGCISCNPNPQFPRCTDNACSDDALNPFSGLITYKDLGRDVLGLYSTPGLRQYTVKNFMFQFTDHDMLRGLASPSAGLIGLGRTTISLQAQLASAFNISKKFALCIPSSNNVGNLIIGDAAYKTPVPKIATTPLLRNPVSIYGNGEISNFTYEYFINVKSIRVGGISLALNNTLLSIDRKTGGGGTSIRTMRAYTTLHKSIYTALVDKFVKLAEKKGIKRVASVAPFSACFDSKTIASSKTGPDVPTVDLVLQSKSVYWRFYGANSMVGVGKDVMCLAFVEGVPYLTGPNTAIEVGGYQMENYLVEFDEASSRVRFSSSLLLHGTSCSHLKAA